ncbi:MAG: glycogen debranching protein GlgX [Chloroflexi bacterium]|nr:glycogen debranching protein GlgX [Chloroflexota bacterium]
MTYELKTKTKKKLSPGKFYPLGASLEDGGVNFAIYSQFADEVYLLLFDDPAADPTDIIQLTNRDKFIWHIFVEDIKAGQLYAYKIRGKYDPANGLRFNENKLLIDPYAKALTGKFRNKDNLLLAYNPFSPDKDLVMDPRDNTAIVPKSIVVDDNFDWQGDEPPGYHLDDLIFYEVHVKGFTAHPSSGVKHPGTYPGFIEKIPYLKKLGINAVEFLPVHEYYVDDFLLDKGLTNYWGYNSIAFFAPECSYRAGKRPGCQVDEFKTLVRELHRAGIEVILDVVYNHSGEGNELGPTMCFKGVDNPTYYLLSGSAGQPFRYYMNYTGCGNSLNLSSPPVIRLVMDSLRYWVEVMHVDGFRFDLASELGRQDGRFERNSGFFDAIGQDPVLSRVKLIAEPWDLGSYDVGNFPIDWSEWNGRFRDTLRKFGKGDAGQLKELRSRMTGSPDLFCDDGRAPYNSINFITCHDGFTLYDLVSYNGKHNEANLEDNRDGANDNNSWNCGCEGETDDPEIIKLRKKQIKNFICCEFFSLGSPLMQGGDEFMRTQKGNNNAYCQDNEISWFDWSGVEKNKEIFEFFRKAILFVKNYHALQDRKYVTKKLPHGRVDIEIKWYGRDLGEPLWDDPEQRTLCYRLSAKEKAGPGIEKYSLFFILNADYLSRDIKLPPAPHEKGWKRVIDTSLPEGEDFIMDGDPVVLDPQDHYLANPRSTVVLLSGGKYAARD